MESIKATFEMFGQHMTEISKASMIYGRLKKLLKTHPAQEFSLEQASKALDIPDGQEYLLMLQSQILRLHQEERISFNANKTKFQHRERN